MQAEFLRGSLKDDPGRFYRQRWQWIRLRTPRLKRIRSRQARNAELFFGLGVVRLEVRVRDRPIRQARSGYAAPLTLLLEVRFPEPPVIRREVHRSAPHLAPVLNDLLLRNLCRFRV